MICWGTLGIGRGSRSWETVLGVEGLYMRQFLVQGRGLRLGMDAHDWSG